MSAPFSSTAHAYLLSVLQGCVITIVIADLLCVDMQESVMLDAFYAGVTSCVDPDCRKSLKVLP